MKFRMVHQGTRDRRRRRDLRRVLGDFVALGLLLVAALTLLGFAGNRSYYAELTAHFAAYYLTAAIVGTILATLLRRRFSALFGAAVVACHAYAIVPWYHQLDRGNNGANGFVLRFLVSNVHTGNTRYDDILALVNREQPDIILLQEVNRAWVDALGVLEEEYPHRLIEPREDNFGIAVYSQQPLERARLTYLGGTSVQSILADLLIGDTTLGVVNVHTLPPASREYARMRDAQLYALPWLSKEDDKLHVIAGDLNATMWSPSYAEMMRRFGGDVVDARKGFGLNPSWRTWPFIRLPLDTVLVSSEIRVDDFRLGPDLGSDHLPLIVDLRVSD